jgi:hypothetical protein
MKFRHAKIKQVVTVRPTPQKAGFDPSLLDFSCSASSPAAVLLRLSVRWSRARHLPVSSSVFGRVVCLEHTRLTFVCLREGITSLLSHALDLPHFADSLLELLHSASSQYRIHAAQFKFGRGIRTLVCSLECCTSGSPECSGMSVAGTCA